jgi:hypothetical protein
MRHIRPGFWCQTTRQRDKAEPELIPVPKEFKAVLIKSRTRVSRGYMSGRFFDDRPIHEPVKSETETLGRHYWQVYQIGDCKSSVHLISPELEKVLVTVSVLGSAPFIREGRNENEQMAVMETVKMR